MALVALFSNTKVTTMKVHASGCPMVNTGKRPGRKGAVTLVPADAFTLVDMEERGFGFSFCKCCPKAEKQALLEAVKAHGPTGQS
jgi:hypothetical protein